ncbi:MAG: LysE family translocator [Pseudomonadota bacterium]
MHFEDLIIFAVSMFLWALLPGPGLAIVVSRTAGSGVRAGFAVVTGLALADIVFLGVAFVGLLAIAATLGPLFDIVKYAGAAYLMWRGYRAIVGKDGAFSVGVYARGTLWRDMAMGMLATLGNPKAIVFFGALLPTFIDMTHVGAGNLLALAAVVAGVSYLIYGTVVLMVDRARRFIASAKAMRRLQQVTGTVLIGSGVAVATR